jgi:hypothetical protein
MLSLGIWERNYNTKEGEYYRNIGIFVLHFYGMYSRFDTRVRRIRATEIEEAAMNPKIIDKELIYSLDKT